MSDLNKQNAAPEDSPLSNEERKFIDRYVGSRLRIGRMVIGMSQTELGEKVGKIFQQIQKYEKGENRIGAGLLHFFAEIIGVKVDWFYEGMPPVGKAKMVSKGEGKEHLSSALEAAAKGEFELPLLDYLGSSEGFGLNYAFQKVSDPERRRRIVELVRAASEAETPPTTHGLKKLMALTLEC